MAVVLLTPSIALYANGAWTHRPIDAKSLGAIEVIDSALAVLPRA